MICVCTIHVWTIVHWEIPSSAERHDRRNKWIKLRQAQALDWLGVGKWIGGIQTIPRPGTVMVGLWNALVHHEMMLWQRNIMEYVCLPTVQNVTGAVLLCALCLFLVNVSNIKIRTKSTMDGLFMPVVDQAGYSVPTSKAVPNSQVYFVSGLNDAFISK